MKKKKKNYAVGLVLMTNSFTNKYRNITDTSYLFNSSDGETKESEMKSITII